MWFTEGWSVVRHEQNVWTFIARSWCRTVQKDRCVYAIFDQQHDDVGHGSDDVMYLAGITGLPRVCTQLHQHDPIGSGEFCTLAVAGALAEARVSQCHLPFCARSCRCPGCLKSWKAVWFDHHRRWATDADIVNALRQLGRAETLTSLSRVYEMGVNNGIARTERYFKRMRGQSTLDCHTGYTLRDILRKISEHLWTWLKCSDVDPSIT